MKVTQRPHKFCFSKNPVQYTFSVPDFASAGCYALIRIYKRDIGGANEVFLYEERIKPLTSSLIYDVSSIVESSLEYALPDFSGSIAQAGQNIKEFYVSFCTITDAAPTASYTSDAANFLYIVKGGIPQPLWDWNNYFINYVPANKPFLTWQPNNRFIGLNDSFFLSFLNSTTAPASFDLLIDVEFTDNTTQQVVTNFASDKILYHIAAGPDQLGLNALQPTKKLYKYSLSIVSAADHSIIFVAAYTYYIDYRKFYNTKFLHYYNSLGGIECVRINGEIETTADIAFTDSEVFNGTVIIGQPGSEQYTQTAKSKTDSFKGDTGFFFSKKEMDVLQELLLARFAWERIVGKNWRIYVSNKSTKLRTTSDKKWSLGIEWRYSFTNSVYAPLLDLGAGIDSTEYCIPVNISGTPSLPDAVAGEAYSSSIELTGDAPISVGNVSPAWINVTISGTTANISGTPSVGDVGINIPVSIQFLNCSANAKIFTDTINVSCIAFAGSTIFPIAHINIPYTFSMYLNGIAPFTLSNFAGPSWMSAVVVDDHIDFSGTPDVIDNAIPVSFTISSCTSLDYSSMMSVDDSCDEYYNNSGQPQDITYTPCGTADPVSITVADGGSVCGKNFSGAGFGFLTRLGYCF